MLSTMNITKRKSYLSPVSCFLAACFLTISPLSYAQNTNVVIGIFSPTSGKTQETGQAHNHWVEHAFERTGTSIRGLNRSFSIERIKINSQSVDASCERKLRDFVRDYPNSVAIIGPVRSGCVESILAADEPIPIPIISAMASATDLTEAEQQWFFRANTNDRNRLRELLNYVRQSTDTYTTDEKILIYDGMSKYGLGLRDDLLHLEQGIENLSIENALAMSPIEQRHLVNSKHVFLLGDSESTGNLIAAISEYSEPLSEKTRIYTVGESIVDWKMENVITVGEVAFPDSDAIDATRELRRIAADANEHGVRFYPTVYTAARHILYSALESAPFSNLMGR